MSPHVDALAPSGLSFAEQRARRSAAAVGVSPASSTAFTFAPLSSSATHAGLCPFTAAQCSGVLPHESLESTAATPEPMEPRAFPRDFFRPFAPPVVEGTCTPSMASATREMTLEGAPALAATCSAVCPSSSATDAAPPLSKISVSSDGGPLAAAIVNAL